LRCSRLGRADADLRITPQVLSVVAQQLATIQGALRAGAERFNFEGREMRLVRLQRCAGSTTEGAL
jgi:dynein heavy chain